MMAAVLSTSQRNNILEIAVAMSSSSSPVQTNMVDLEKTDTYLARNIVVSVQGTPEQQQQLQDHWGFYAIALIRQCVFDLAEAAGSEGKAYQVATMKVRVLYIACLP